MLRGDGCAASTGGHMYLDSTGLQPQDQAFGTSRSGGGCRLGVRSR